jgi:hypothetical protein
MMSSSIKDELQNAVASAASPKGESNADESPVTKDSTAALAALVLEEQASAFVNAAFDSIEESALTARWNTLKEDGKSELQERFPSLPASVLYIIFQGRKDAQAQIVSERKQGWKNIFCAHAATLNNDSASRNHASAMEALKGLYDEFPATHRDALSKYVVAAFKDQRGLAVDSEIVERLCDLYNISPSVLLKR